MADNKQLILQESNVIALDKDVKIHIKDDVEGDMDFVFKLEKRQEDKGSYTRYNVIDSHTGEIAISNVNINQSIALDNLRIGTYKKEYFLFVSFTITHSEDQKQMLNTKFYIVKRG